MIDDTRETWIETLESRTKGRSSEALANCERSLKLDPNQWRLWIEYGSALFGEQFVREGMEAYFHALTLQPCSVWLWDRIGGVFSRQMHFQKAFKCYVVVERLVNERKAETGRDASALSADDLYLGKRAAEAIRGISQHLVQHGFPKAEIDRIVDRVRQGLPTAPRSRQQMVDLIASLELRDTDERASDLHSRAAAFLRGPCILSGTGRNVTTLVGRYLAGATWDDAELRDRLTLSVAAAQREALSREGATEPWDRDAHGVYQRAALILQEIQAEVSVART